MAFSIILESISQVYKQVYNTRLASKQSYSLPKTRTNFGIFNIRYQGPKIWNSLDETDKKLLELLPNNPIHCLKLELILESSILDIRDPKFGILLMRLTKNYLISI